MNTIDQQRAHIDDLEEQLRIARRDLASREEQARRSYAERQVALWEKAAPIFAE